MNLQTSRPAAGPSYLKCSGIQHSQKGSTEFQRSDPEPVSIRVQSRETRCLCRAISCPRMLSEKLLRASQLETPSPRIYLNQHLPPSLVLSEAGWHGRKAFPKYQLEVLPCTAWDVHHLFIQLKEWHTQEGTSRTRRLTWLQSWGPWCTPSSLGRVSPDTVAVTTCNHCYVAVCQEELVCLVVCLVQASSSKQTKRREFPILHLSAF